jgi:magnesium-transporting ATPase (P-type)
MPAQEHQLLIEHEPLRRERQALQDLLQNLHLASDRVLTRRRGRQEATTNLDVLRQNHPHYAQREFGRVAGYLFIVFMAVAVYFIDVLLFSPVAEYISRLAFADSSFLLNATRFLVPLMIIAIEIGLSILIFRAREENRELGEARRFNMWLFVGIIFAITVPVLVIATTMATAEMLDDKNSFGLFLLIGMTLLALIPHAAVIFGGRLAHEGKAYLLYRWDERKYLRQMRIFDRHLPIQQRNVRDTFSRYYQRLNRVNNHYPNAHITPGPFTNPTRSLVV